MDHEVFISWFIGIFVGLVIWWFWPTLAYLLCVAAAGAVVMTVLSSFFSGYAEED